MKLILCGGGTGEQTTIANNKLNEIINHSKPILYIPLAMDEKWHPYDGCYEWVQGELSNVKVSSIEMVRSFEELRDKNFNNYCALFIGGGNTYKLLHGLKKFNIFEKIKEYITNDGVVIGGSAGAVIFGKDIDIANGMDPNEINFKDTAGFDVLNGLSIFPHYTNKKSKLSEVENELMHKKCTDSIIAFSKTNGDVIAIPEEDAIYVDDNGYKVIGTLPYYISKNGEIKKYKLR